MTSASRTTSEQRHRGWHVEVFSFIMENAVKLIAITGGAGPLQDRSAEDIIAYAARVSNPKNQENFDTAPKLLGYCLKHGHFSVFETVSMSVEVTTSRAIADQIIRHRSFCIQQLSARYAETPECLTYNPRRQDKRNRQNSLDDMDVELHSWFDDAQKHVQDVSTRLYRDALDKGIAKECARFLLPMSSKTVLYMTGNCRSFIHYIDARTAEATQREHRDVALQIKAVFIENFPATSRALGWCV